MKFNFTTTGVNYILKYIKIENIIKYNFYFFLKELYNFIHLLLCVFIYLFYKLYNFIHFILTVPFRNLIISIFATTYQLTLIRVLVDY